MPAKAAVVDFAGRFNQLNLLLAPEVKDSELLKKKSYEFKIKGVGEASAPAILTSPNAFHSPASRASPSVWLLFPDPWPYVTVHQEYLRRSVLHCWMQIAPNVYECQL